ncbi:MAG: DUF1349 domain-containing protein [Clostridia bacterium]|nr:DUF1349 domain-containing protein [Clostridia bacterium]
MNMQELRLRDWEWIRAPKQYEILENGVTWITEPETDLWQRTYYGFQVDNAPILRIRTAEKYFTFSVKASFEPAGAYDQCGIAVYLDSDNWMKASIEYENEQYSRLGSVVTNHGYSDWATRDIPSDVRELHYRLSRRESDFRIETSPDGIHYEQMRIFHLREGSGDVDFGVYACSPTESSFTARFTRMKLEECLWSLPD